MITRAKVDLSAVRTFRQTVMSTRDFSQKFDRGETCIDQLREYLRELSVELKDKIEVMKVSRENLILKIKNIENAITEQTMRLNELQEEASELEIKLSGMSQSIAVKNADGSESEISNPAYEALVSRMFWVEEKIRSVESERYSYQQKLEHADSVGSQLSTHIDACNGIIYSLEEKQNICKHLWESIKKVQESSFRNSSSALDNLKRIEQIIDGYMRIKMKYDTIQPGTVQQSGGININININRSGNSEMHNDVHMKERQYQRYSENEIKQHQIRYDANGHICEYKGRQYGGQYNSYEERLSHTSKNDPMLGMYTGVRGESQYIPSNRSAEGVAVIAILKKYNQVGIEYRNGEPDFEVCAEAIVTIDGMSENRENYLDHNGIARQGNFMQADIALAKIWNFEEKDGCKTWQPRDVFNFRKANGLTWHEKCDTKTMVLVKTEINAYFKHSGGCSECRVRDGHAVEGDGFDE